MNIALIAHDAKKELMVQFCIAYCGILSRHSLCATGTTGKLVSEATGLNITCFMAGSQGGDQQISSRISCNEIDLLLYFRNPIGAKATEPDEASLLRLCDVYNIPYATNIASAEAMIHALENGDLDWRDIVNPKREKRQKTAGPLLGPVFCRLFPAAAAGRRTEEPSADGKDRRGRFGSAAASQTKTALPAGQCH